MIVLAASILSQTMFVHVSSYFLISKIETNLTIRVVFSICFQIAYKIHVWTNVCRSQTSVSILRLFSALLITDAGQEIELWVGASLKPSFTCQMRLSWEHIIEIQSRFRSKQVLLATFHGLNRLNPISLAANGGTAGGCSDTHLHSVLRLPSIA